MNNPYELKVKQDDFKDLRVIKEASSIFDKLVTEVPHTILVWRGCPIKEELQTAFEQSTNSFEKRISIIENPTVEKNMLVIMNREAEVLDVVEINWEEKEEEKTNVFN